MAKYDFTKYKANTEAEKVSPHLEHEFRPIKDDQDIVVKCSYFKAGERTGFIDFSEGRSASFNFRRVFQKKVISIEGLVLTVTDEKTDKPKDIVVSDPQVLLNFPDVGIVNDIVTEVARHIVNADELTEDEEGN